MKLLLLLLFLAQYVGAATAVLDGAKVHYVSAGKGPESVVLIHGWTCDHTLWGPQIEALSAKYRVLALDLPGHGASDPAPDYSMKRFARAVEAVMRAEKVDRAVLAGHSMGGVVMLEFLRLYPAKAAGLIAVDAMFIDTAGAAGFGPFAARFQGPEALENRRKMVEGMFTGATSEEVRGLIRKVMLGTAPETAAGAMQGMANPAAWGDDVHEAPFIQIAAATSEYITEEALKRRFPRATLVRIPETGHFLHLEKPAEVNRVMQEWLASR
ncbi:MAG: alpha/beta hydrolase [Bryobacteraceae bacterium]|nr:alpha/beta hydrolase [Solibacteraceae bacterium]MCO5352142.1 alpha/beta hydrolase [Bryobacteraceae bacterium]